MPVIVIMVALVAAFILLIWKQAEQKIWKRTIFLFAVCIVVIFTAIMLQYTTAHTIVITALNQKNEQAEGSEIWLKSVIVNQEDYPANEIFSDNWIWEDGYLKWRSYSQKEGMTAQIRASFDIDDEVQLVFDSNQWRGKVEIRDGWRTVELDCYKNGGNGSLFYDLQEMSWSLRIPGKILFAAMSMMLCLAAGISMIGHRIRKKEVFSKTSDTQTDREVWLDVLKVISAFLVVLIHTIGSAYRTLPIGSKEWVHVLWLNAIPRCAVPIFMMVSGVLLLNREVSFAKMRRNLYHGIILFLFWNIFYIFLQAILHGPQQDILKYIISLPVQRGPSGHLWYSFFIVWFYLFSPILGGMYRALTMKQRIYFVAVALLLPSALDLYSKEVLHASAVISSTALTMTINYVGLLFLGRIIYDLKDRLKKLQMMGVGFILSSGGLLGMVYLAYRYGITYGKVTDQYFMETHFCALLYSTGVFLIAARYSSIGKRFSKVIQCTTANLSRYSIGIYFFHCATIWMIGDFTLFGIWISQKGSALTAFICCVVYYILSVIVVWLIGQIPGIKKLVT